MATLGQATTTFDEDTFTLRFTFSDITSNFTSTGWSAWWGCAVNSTWPSTTTLVRDKATSNWIDGPTSPDDEQVFILNNTNVIEVRFDQDDFGTNSNQLDADTEYYMELVVSDNKTKARSVTAAQGTFQVNTSLFTEEGYR